MIHYEVVFDENVTVIIPSNKEVDRHEVFISLNDAKDAVIKFANDKIEQYRELKRITNKLTKSHFK